MTENEVKEKLKSIYFEHPEAQELLRHNDVPTFYKQFVPYHYRGPMTDLFYSCDIDVINLFRREETIPRAAFFNMSHHIDTLDLSNFKNLLEIRPLAFANADINEIILPDNLKLIRESALNSMRLKKIHIPAKIEYIRDSSLPRKNVKIEYDNDLDEFGKCFESGVNPYNKISSEEGTKLNVQLISTTTGEVREY